MKTAMESLKGMVDVNTVVGDPVETQSGDVIVPISRVSFGFATGGGEYAARPGADSGDGSGEFPFAGGSGAGVSVQPVVGQGTVRMLPVEGGQPLDRLIDMAPQIIDKLRGRTRKPAPAAGGTDQGVGATQVQ